MGEASPVAVRLMLYGQTIEGVQLAEGRLLAIDVLELAGGFSRPEKLYGKEHGCCYITLLLLPHQNSRLV